jgi:hypothetical protein
MKAFHVTLRNECWEWELPGLLPMVREPAEFLWVQPQLTCHLDMQIAQVKALLGFRPGVVLFDINLIAFARIRVVTSYRSQPVDFSVHSSSLDRGTPTAVSAT